MCGITGFLDPRASDAALLSAQAQRMADTLAHRGPDAEGVWADARAGLALAHRRLSIVDLSPAGAQPMRDHSGRFVITLNGEIYNYEEVRSALPGGTRVWRGHSDTEVLLEAIATWGVTGALERCVGMFAFALWDRETRTLTLARDRFGEKPLYYGVSRGVLLFGSELKALRAHAAFEADIDRQVLDTFLRIGCIPAPHSIYTGIFKLPPATTLRIDAPPGAPLRVGQPASYWSLDGVAPSSAGLEGATERLDHLLQIAVAGQMSADVPVGAFLSGGIDSSLAVALMQEQSPRPVNTFSIGFEEGSFNEAHHAAAVARHLGTCHTGLTVTAADARAVIPGLPSMYDEPFADSSQIPTCLVAKLARTQVTVSLSGDGADELFGGYNRHVLAAQHGARLMRSPYWMRSTAGALLRTFRPSMWDAASRLLPRARLPVRPGEKVHKLAAVLGAQNEAGLYARLVAQYAGPSLVAGVGSVAELPAWPLRDGPDLAARMMRADAAGYLPDDILVKVDRATMAVGLESRTPYLDHRVAEFAFALPREMHVRDGQGKHLLRELLYRRVPRDMLDRPKQGFGVPIDSWLRGPLKQWAADLLAPERLRREGYLDGTRVDALWQTHLSGARDEQHALWSLLMFQAWRPALNRFPA